MKAEKNQNPKSLFDDARRAPVGRDFLESFRKNLAAYVEANPAAEEISDLEFVRSPWRAAVPVFAFLVLVLLAAGTALASRKSLPGDVLYPAKLLTERAVVAMVFGPEARTRARLGFAAERVAEVSSLAARDMDEGKYRAGVQAALQDFNVQISGIFAEAQILKSKNPAEAFAIAGRVHAATEAYASALAGADGERGAMTGEMLGFTASNNAFHALADAETGNRPSGEKEGRSDRAIAETGMREGVGRKNPFGVVSSTGSAFGLSATGTVPASDATGTPPARPTGGVDVPVPIATILSASTTATSTGTSTTIPSSIKH